ncbi:MAG: bifunctional precorrin-2 dehydrogenase/sirohydrochlorin ferrochelatase [Actinomycetota bacterium]|nr:bifunctional precorrin-2 dehydrogenase/sirohydrochlorin ferrochelatase [Actinomycetota bacterium]
MGLMLHVDVRDLDVVVVGGGAAGREKVERLLAAGAKVILIDPVAPDLRLPELAVERRDFAEYDVDGAWLVVAATANEAVNDEVERAARAAGALVTRADRPDGGGIAFAAVLERGPVIVGVATGGASPALSRWLRDRIARVMPAAIGELATLLAARRRSAGRRGHRDLPLDDALAALEAGDESRARALLGVTADPS